MMSKKETRKKPVLALVVLSLLFYGIMLFLSVSAKNIHYARLPQVTASSIQKQSFTYSYTTDYGTIQQTKLCAALPKDMVDSGQVFIITTDSRDDFIYYYAQRVSVVIDAEKENADYYAIASGIAGRDLVILSGYEDLEDGDEVYLQKEKKETSKTQTENIFQ